MSIERSLHALADLPHDEIKILAKAIVIKPETIKAFALLQEHVDALKRSA